MPRTCTICNHEKREQIEKSLIEGVPFRRIAAQYGVGCKSVERHQSCITEGLKKARENREIKHGLTNHQQLKRLRDSTERILDMCMGNLSPLNGELALKAIDRRHKQIELAARLDGEFKQDAPNPATVESLVNQAAAELLKDAESEGVEMTIEEAAEMVRPHIESQMTH